MHQVISYEVDATPYLYLWIYSYLRWWVILYFFLICMIIDFRPLLFRSFLVRNYLSILQDGQYTIYTRHWSLKADLLQESFYIFCTLMIFFGWSERILNRNTPLFHCEQMLENPVVFKKKPHWQRIFCIVEI